jgi:hypothetical protein
MNSGVVSGVVLVNKSRNNAFDSGITPPVHNCDCFKDTPNFFANFA